MSETHNFTVTAYPVYAVRVVVQAATPQEAIDKACEAVDWLALERSRLRGAEWVQFSETWESFSTSNGDGVQWFGPDGVSPLVEPQAAVVVPTGQETPPEPCQHDWQPTDTECHSMECTRCGALWTLEGGEIGTLVIRGVGLDLLEAQRLSLGEAVAQAGASGLHLTPDQVDALTGVMNLLDAWSDVRAKKGEAAS